MWLSRWLRAHRRSEDLCRYVSRPVTHAHIYIPVHEKSKTTETLGRQSNVQFARVSSYSEKNLLPGMVFDHMTFHLRQSDLPVHGCFVICLDTCQTARSRITYIRTIKQPQATMPTSLKPTTSSLLVMS